MAVQASETCQIKSFLSTCGGARAGVCVYCGRAFCQRHGFVREDGQDVCSRKECVAKREDLARHLAYKEGVARLNDLRACGLAGCGQELDAQCVRCKGLFCQAHVLHRDETILENSVRVHRMATVCRHCADRRGIWTKL